MQHIVAKNVSVGGTQPAVQGGGGGLHAGVDDAHEKGEENGGGGGQDLQAQLAHRIDGGLLQGNHGFDDTGIGRACCCTC